MSQPLARLYDLALRALDEQDRQANALRGRLGPVLAAAALRVSLLSSPVVGAIHPASVGGKLAIAVAVIGLFVTIVSVLRLLAAEHRSIDAIDPRELLDNSERSRYLEDDATFYEAMITQLGAYSDRSAKRHEQLAATFTAMLWGILVMLCGLALAAIVG